MSLPSGGEPSDLEPEMETCSTAVALRRVVACDIGRLVGLLEQAFTIDDCSVGKSPMLFERVPGVETGCSRALPPSPRYWVERLS